MSGDMREDLEAALADAQGSEEATSNEPAESASAVPARDRSEDGKFAPKVAAVNEVLEDKEPGEESSVKEEPSEGQVVAPVQPATRAPASWRPEEREEWAKLSPQAQAAVVRREREIGEALRTTSDARHFSSAMQQALQPYMPMIQAENSNPIAAVQAVMQTAAVLRTAPPAQKAQAVADMIHQFGIDINILDQALSARASGRQMPADPMAPMLQAIEQRLAPVQEFMKSWQTSQQQARQQETQQIEQTLEQFLNDPANEFAADVSEEMADVLEIAARRGQQMSLQDAYARGILLHPTISKVVEARKSGKGLAQQTAAARNARNAAASVGSGGAPSASSGEENEGDDLRSALGASVRQLSARR